MREFNVLNLGAGVQSTTLYLMSMRAQALGADGAFPRFDVAIFADTGDEPQEVYRHLMWLDSRSVFGGAPIIVRSAGTLSDDLVNGRNTTGGRFRQAACIVASPPCPGVLSYMAMPWSRAKKIAAEYRDGTRNVADLTRLFDACFRIQREAGGIPLVVENVKGAQPWVGPARWHYGSFYLWGDVPALMPHSFGRKVAMNFHEYEKTGKPGRSFQSAAVEQIKGTGGSWFTPDADDRKPGHWKEAGCVTRCYNSKDVRRKAASAQIAKIPFPLAQHIARVFRNGQHTATPRGLCAGGNA